MTQVAVFAQLRAHPGKGDELVTVLQTLAAVAQQQPRTLTYTVHRVHDDPDAIWIYELHADRAALEDNAAHEAAIAIGPKMLDLLAESPLLTFGHPVHAPATQDDPPAEEPGSPTA